MERWCLGGLLLVLAVSGCKRQAPATGEAPMSREQAIAAAQGLYRKKKDAGTDFANGPCLGVVGGWAVDVAHDPRQPVDDRPENQCAAYRDGTVSHFVELDPNGRLIRAQ